MLSYCIIAVHAPSVAAVHNRITEGTWTAIMQYESMYPTTPRLCRFSGMDGIFSPKAKFRHYILGQPWPYDRHDWWVERDGQEVRYVIDYYAYPKAGDDGDSLYTIDARPALDGWRNMFDRAKFTVLKLLRLEN